MDESPYLRINQGSGKYGAVDEGRVAGGEPRHVELHLEEVLDVAEPEAGRHVVGLEVAWAAQELGNASLHGQGLALYRPGREGRAAQEDDAFDELCREENRRLLVAR
jgi:hypothetical protein